MTGLGDLFTWNTVAPRVGANLRLTNDNKTTLRTSYGRAYRPVFLNDYSIIYPNISPTTVAGFNAATGQYSTIISVTNPISNIKLDPNIKAPYTDSFSIGIDRELIPNMALNASFVHKDAKDQIGWNDIGATYVSAPVALPVCPASLTGQCGPWSGRRSPRSTAPSPDSTSLFQRTNPDGFFNRYNGMVLAVEKRLSHSWQANFSYTLSKSEGCTTNSQDPNARVNCAGLLGPTGTHVFSTNGMYQFRKLDSALAVNFIAQKGNPFAPQAQVRLNQGNVTLNIAPIRRHLPAGYAEDSVLPVHAEPVPPRQQANRALGRTRQRAAGPGQPIDHRRTISLRRRSTSPTVGRCRDGSISRRRSSSKLARHGRAGDNSLSCAASLKAARPQSNPWLESTSSRTMQGWRFVAALLLTLLSATTARLQNASLNARLLEAAGKGDVATAKALLDQGADVDADNGRGGTPLYVAAEQGHAGVARLLLERGADPNVKDLEWGRTPLRHASLPDSRPQGKIDRAEIIKMLLDKGSGSDGDALSDLIQGGHIEAAKTILSRGKVDPSYLNGALRAAQRARASELVEILVKAGAKEPGPMDSARSAERLKLVNGLYRSASGQEVTLGPSPQGDTLLLGRRGQNRTALLPLDFRMFRSFDMKLVMTLSSSTLPPEGVDAEGRRSGRPLHANR